MSGSREAKSAAGADAADGDPHVLARDTTPTWQGELLLSGGVVFALLQLPAWIDAAYANAIPRLNEGRYWVATYAYIYASCANYSLILAFIAHLGLRAWWVALVGLNSVYPHGPRWENYRAGPVAREWAQSHYRPLGEHIARTDNFATLVFSIGVLIAVIASFVGALTVAVVALGLVLTSAVGRPDWFATVLVTLVILLFIPLALGGMLDRWVLPRFPANTWLRRSLRAQLDAFNRFTRSSLWTEPLLLFTTQHPGSRGNHIVYGAMSVLLIGAAFVQSVQRGGIALDSFSAFPGGGGTHLVDAAYYLDQRSAKDPARALPTISSATPSGDWLPLFVPFSARSDEARLGRRCPTVALDPLSSAREPELASRHAAEGSRRRALIECIVGLRPVTLDGATASALTWDFYRDPDSDLAGLLTMIPLRDLAPGRHEIRVQRNTDPDDPPGQQREPHYIAFWK